MKFLGKTLLAVPLFLVMGTVFAQTDADVSDRMRELGMSAVDASRLIAGERLSDLSVKGKTDLRYFISSGYLSGALSGDVINPMAPQVSVESLSYLPDAATPTDRVAFFNKLLDLSTLAGARYFSDADKRNKTSYISADLISAPAGSPIKVSPVTTRPPRRTVYARLEDDLYGVGDYQVNYYTQGDEVAMVITNLGTIKKSFLFTIEPKGRQTILYFLPLPKGALLYQATLDAKDGVSLSRDKDNRAALDKLEALKGWFVARISS